MLLAGGDLERGHSDGLAVAVEGHGEALTVGAQGATVDDVCAGLDARHCEVKFQVANFELS